MKNIKRIIAAALVSVMALGFTACHKKDETAVTVGKVNFTSAYYMCALINADSEAKSKVKESLSDSKSSTDIDYYSKKVEDKDFVKWVEDTALKNLKKIAAYKTLCEENKLEISEDDKKNAETYANYYWSNYGYSSYFEPNGVGENTYKQYMLDSYYSSVYFEHLYSKGGTKEIAADEVKTKLYDNFVIADMLQGSFSGKNDDEKTEIKNKFNTYLEDLKSGKKTFEAVYKEQNGSTDNSSSTSTEKKQPKDKYASILGSKDTSYSSDQYDTVKAMATGEVKLIELADNAGLILAVKQDIKADDYYIDTLDLASRHLIADDDFDKEITDYANKMECKVNDYAVKQFKVKKIKEPNTSSNSR